MSALVTRSNDDHDAFQFTAIECPQQPAVSKFGDYFQFIMRNSSSERLTLLMNKEVEMADQVGMFRISFRPTLTKIQQYNI